ncbi:MAG: hypothetical protein FWC49_02025 [Proteobacteria bacterium]|nr:hypothetical protein [Pseudomonadota bacterium]
MRFRIMKGKEQGMFLLAASGRIDDDSSWDLLQVAQIMLSMPRCRELVIDLQGVEIDDDLSTLNTDILVSVFEESLLLKDCTLIVRFGNNDEIRLCADQLPLEPALPYVNVRLDEAKVYGRAMQWLEKEARLLAH